MQRGVVEISCFQISILCLLSEIPLHTKLIAVVLIYVESFMIVT